MSRFKQQLRKAYGQCSTAYLSNIQEVLLEDKKILHKQHDSLVVMTAGNYSCPSIKAKLSTKITRLSVIKEVLDERLPEMYK